MNYRITLTPNGATAPAETSILTHAELINFIWGNDGFFDYCHAEGIDQLELAEEDLIDEFEAHKCEAHACVYKIEAVEE